VGFVTCGIHQRVRCCWRCERCPKCDGIGRLRPGDYCADCVAWMKAHGYRWSAYTRDYIRDGESPSLFPVNAPDADARIGELGSPMEGGQDAY
jgi:hypothetical protein